jgi:hypothetical protein
MVEFLLGEISGVGDEVKKILEARIPAGRKRSRIEGVQARLTNLLISHFGMVMLEVLLLCK